MVLDNMVGNPESKDNGNLRAILADVALLRESLSLNCKRPNACGHSVGGSINHTQSKRCTKPSPDCFRVCALWQLDETLASKVPQACGEVCVMDSEPIPAQKS